MNESNTRPILLTGVTGLIGRHVLYELLREQIESGVEQPIFVTIRPGDMPADDRLRELLQDGARPSYLARHTVDSLAQRVRVLEVDLIDERLREFVEAHVGDGCYVIHSAASTNLAPSEDAEEEIKFGVLGATNNLLDAVKDKAGKFVYIGTSFATGAVAGTIDDDYFALQTGDARNHYERAKLQTEAHLRSYCEDHGMEWQILRPSVVCGRLLDAPLHYMSKFDVFYGFGKFFKRVVEAGCEDRGCQEAGRQGSQR